MQSIQVSHTSAGALINELVAGSTRTRETTWRILTYL